jgi:hypothetical protein
MSQAAAAVGTLIVYSAALRNETEFEGEGNRRRDCAGGGGLRSHRIPIRVTCVCAVPYLVRAVLRPARKIIELILCIHAIQICILKVFP